MRPMRPFPEYLLYGRDFRVLCLNRKAGFSVWEPHFGPLFGIWQDRMAGDQGRAAGKLGCETEIVLVDGSVGFGVFVGRPESEQIPLENGTSGADSESPTRV